MIVVIEGHSTLDSDNIFEEVFRSVVTTLLPTHHLDPARPVITQNAKASTLLYSHTQQSNTALTTDAPNTELAVARDFMTISIANS